MKRIISVVLASMMLLSVAGCGTTAPDTANSVTASASEQLLIDRLGEIPDNVVLGDASVAATYGIDMTDFEDDGYILRTVGASTLVFGKTDEGLDRAVRAYAKAVEAGTDDTLDVVYHEGYRIERLTIAGRDISEYTVYYPDTANENMKFAASELVRLIEIATGVRLPVVVGAPTSPAIELRHSDDPDLRDEGYRYSVTEDGLLIEGAVKRGCMNGVWRFLQLECGWEQLIYGNSCLNESDHIDIPVGTTHTETPIFDFLGFYEGINVYRNERTTPSAAQSSYPMTHPGGHGMVYGEFCSYDINFADEQICYTSEERYEECYYNVWDYVNSLYGSNGFEKVDVGQADNDNYCMCETCLEIFIEDGYTNSGAVIRFMNRLSEEINEDFPGVHLAILAYMSAKEPPKVTRPNEFININFCYDMNCANHPVDGSLCTTEMNVNGLNNKYFDELVRGWCAITDNLYVRNYGINQHLMDNTLIDVLYEDMRYFHDIGVKGFLYEIQSYGLGIKHIEKHLVHELNWNPDMSREEYEAIFCSLLEREYGDGWTYIREYVREWALAQRVADCFHCWGWNTLHYWTDDKLNTHFFKARFDDYMELFEAAAAMADSTAHQSKVELLSCSMLYLGCYSSYFLEYNDKNTERIAVLEERYSLIFDRLIKNGHDPKRLGSLTGAEDDIVCLPDTLYDAAWSEWYKAYDRICGKTLPEDAPVITGEK